MTTGTSSPATPPIKPEPRCTYVVDNGNGMTWHCVLKPHPDDARAEAHYLVRDEVAVAQARHDG